MSNSQFNSRTVIARSNATKQSILSLRGTMDCFASLAMTAVQTSAFSRRDFARVMHEISLKKIRASVARMSGAKSGTLSPVDR
jgi:hypothetical protein